MISKEVEATIPEPASFSSLPDEIAENILARVSRWNYPWLSLVSKRFRSLVSCMEIYKTRSQIGAKETCVYVGLKFPNQPCPSWFSLWSKPNQTKRTKRRGKFRFKQNPRGNLVVPIPFYSSSHYPLIPNDSIVAVGSEIYLIGGPCEEPSTSVGIIDCRNHSWREATSMTVARANATAILFDEKIYVMGGCEVEEHPANWIEVFDIKTQSWTALPGPGDDDEELRDQLRRQYCFIVNVFEGKISLAAEKKEYTYELRDGTWKVIKEESTMVSAEAWCRIEDIVYCYNCSDYLMWSDHECREWREIKGLEKLREDLTSGLKVGSLVYIADYGGKLLVMWDPYYPNSGIKRENKIWYAIISLESKCNGREVWGNVECVDVLTFPGEPYKELYCLIASV